jgi:hypothetical protein
MNAGDVVRVKELLPGSNRTFMDEPKNVLGYVYETYYIGKVKGFSVISENGIDLGCFSSREKQGFAVYVSTLEFVYDFRTRQLLERDWERGLFAPFLEEVRELKRVHRPYRHTDG